MKLAGAFRALPVKDANDGETVLCFAVICRAPCERCEGWFVVAAVTDAQEVDGWKAAA